MSLKNSLINIGVILFWLSLLLISGFYYKRLARPQITYPVLEVVVREGQTMAQIDDLLYEKGVIVEKGSVVNFDPALIAKDFYFLNNVSSLEGFLFPDTYEFYLQSSPDVVIKKMLKNFEVNNRDALLLHPEMYKKLILASLVEKEVPDEKDDRRLVASLIERREKIGMYLGIDASLCYAKNKRWCKDGILTKDDKKLDSPYNTYLKKGFPPTPISNPGLSAIKASLDPKDSKYWYYLSNPKTGETIFSQTIDEHISNIVKYLR